MLSRLDAHSASSFTVYLMSSSEVQEFKVQD